ncbi:pseudouridine synthase-like protein [Thermochaetoides thermophila DSM 1495]|uniref:tRNA pseudouridine(55) synthase n=1 Tax=Chaetomium thermophilum (strain DSM 1495 / CBS 144.50 / IMI 039719) TaxID=759272 RepID=G0SE35_CHATD|nr:pseudouridine synthase-like protein [Thermochaetoides thermophila DSM 1495]EGS18212.1 pseudouridine synthase-like protein [Thermochaetoides thermophila DSM 1495]
MATDKVLEGVFAINKPLGMSSAQVIRDCQLYFNPSKLFAPLLEQERAQRAKESNYQKNRRRKCKQEIRVKMGHGGTLDPLATGVLILGAGKGTKALNNFLACTKTYETIVLFGASTDTYDRTGRIIKKGDYSGVTREAVEKALESFRGRIKQVPPLYSALKMEGKPLYEYAREGKPIPREIETRVVEVSELELVEWYEPGTHPHRWPTEEAGQDEKNLVNSVWDVAKKQQQNAASGAQVILDQRDGKKHDAPVTVDRLESLEEHSSSSKRQKTNEGTAAPAATTATTREPRLVPPQGKGSNLVPPPPSPDTPPPWEGKGPPAAKIRMTVSSGFYVRSLCHDLGEKLGCGAMMAELARTRQGQFVLGGENCMEYEDLLKGEEVWGPKVKHMLELWNGTATSTQTAASDGQKQENNGKKSRESSPAGKRKSSPKRKSREGSPAKQAQTEPVAAASA